MNIEGSCLDCSEGCFFINQNFCQKKCSGRAVYWKNETNECSSFSNNCFICQNSTAECSVCQIGYQISKIDNKKCVGSQGQPSNESNFTSSPLSEEETPQLLNFYFEKVESAISIVFDRRIPTNYRPPWIKMIEIKLILSKKTIDIEVGKHFVSTTNPNTILVYCEMPFRELNGAKFQITFPKFPPSNMDKTKTRRRGLANKTSKDLEEFTIENVNYYRGDDLETYKSSSQALFLTLIFITALSSLINPLLALHTIQIIQMIRVLALTSDSLPANVLAFLSGFRYNLITVAKNYFKVDFGIKECRMHSIFYKGKMSCVITKNGTLVLLLEILALLAIKGVLLIVKNVFKKEKK